MLQSKQIRFAKKLLNKSNINQCQWCCNKFQVFEHTVSGVTYDGMVRLVGICCLSMIKEVISIGVKHPAGAHPITIQSFYKKHPLLPQMPEGPATEQKPI